MCFYCYVNNLGYSLFVTKNFRHDAFPVNEENKILMCMNNVCANRVFNTRGIILLENVNSVCLINDNVFSQLTCN